VQAGQSVAVAPDLTIANPSSDSITTYWIEDLGGGSGHLTVGNATVADNTWVQTTGSWANANYVGGSTAGTDKLEVSMYDSTTGSFVYSSQFSATTHVTASVTGKNLTVQAGQSVAVAPDLTIANPSSDSITTYWIEDLGGGSGHLTVGNGKVADNTWVQTTGSWANANYVGGSTAGTDKLEVSMYDSTTGSFVYSSQFSATTVAKGALTADTLGLTRNPSFILPDALRNTTSTSVSAEGAPTNSVGADAFVGHTGANDILAGLSSLQPSLYAIPIVADRNPVPTAQIGWAGNDPVAGLDLSGGSHGGRLFVNQP
jgi:hypothetical protein